jgi:hypothetical protein
MKKLLVLMLCILLVCALPTIAYAEETTTEEAAPEEELTTTEIITEWVMSHLEEISVIFTLIISLFYQVKKHGALNKSVATLNNNAVTVAEDSKSAISQALTDVSAVSAVINGFTEQVTSLLAEIRDQAGEKKSLEETLAEAQNVLKTAKLANIEFANELAELLILANIPNSKKEELYQRHRAAIASIAEAEKTTEVIENVGEEA